MSYNRRNYTRRNNGRPTRPHGRHRTAPNGIENRTRTNGIERVDQRVPDQRVNSPHGVQEPTVVTQSTTTTTTTVTTEAIVGGTTKTTVVTVTTTTEEVRSRRATRRAQAPRSRHGAPRGGRAQEQHNLHYATRRLSLIHI